MGQLFKQTNGHNILWSSGCSLFFVSRVQGSSRLHVAVECRIGSGKEPYLALLDTGAEWSVIGGETAKILEDELDTPIEKLTMSTRLGRINGSLHRINIILLAEQNSGYDLTIDSSVFVSKDWLGPIVLGYRGFLERIRFAIDPGVAPGEQMFYFGLPG
jgi:hypothetical protein